MHTKFTKDKAGNRGLSSKQVRSKSSYKFVNGKRVAVLRPVCCAVCKTNFQPREARSKYCSKQCYYKMKSVRGDRVKWTPAMRKRLSHKYIGAGNPMYGKQSWSKGKKRPEIAGKNHHKWNGGSYIMRGYRWLSNNGEEIPEHRYIMEQHLKRKLKQDEIVHHINHDKLDNRVENLQVLTRSEHPKIHNRYNTKSGSYKKFLN